MSWADAANSTARYANSRTQSYWDDQYQMAAGYGPAKAAQLADEATQRMIAQYPDVYSGERAAPSAYVAPQTAPKGYSIQSANQTPFQDAMGVGQPITGPTAPAPGGLDGLSRLMQTFGSDVDRKITALKQDGHMPFYDDNPESQRDYATLMMTGVPERTAYDTVREIETNPMGRDTILGNQLGHLVAQYPMLAPILQTGVGFSTAAGLHVGAADPGRPNNAPNDAQLDQMVSNAAQTYKPAGSPNTGDGTYAAKSEAESEAWKAEMRAKAGLPPLVTPGAADPRPSGGGGDLLAGGAGTLLTAAGPVVGGIIAGNAAQNAANTEAQAARDAATLQNDAANRSVDLQREQFNAMMAREKAIYDQQRQDTAPWRLAGENALEGLNRFEIDNPAFSFSTTGANADPSYTFRFNEGVKALQNSAAARGGLISGNTMKGLQEFGQQAASQEYQNAFNRYQTERGSRLNRLQSLAGVGQSAVQQAGQAGQNYANATGQAGQNYANSTGNAMIGGANALAGGTRDAASANASGYVGGANALNNAISGAVNAYSNNQWMNALMNRK